MNKIFIYSTVDNFITICLHYKNSKYVSQRVEKEVRKNFIIRDDIQKGGIDR